MTKTWCDACRREITNQSQRQVSIPCHLFSFKEKCGYVDTEGNNVSGREDTIVLCLKCFNDGWGAFTKTLNIPRKEHLSK